MRMQWVLEDFEELAGLVECGNRGLREKASLAQGELILRLRRGLQISQLQLAERAGVPRSLVARVEAGGDVQVSSLRRLLKALGCELVILPASQDLLAHFTIKAAEQRRGRRRWERARRAAGVDAKPSAESRD